MEFEFVAFDSFGIKSSCVRIVTDDVSIVIDPGIAAETGSFPLSWSERIQLCAEYEKKIISACSRSDVIIITHYHYDHFIDERNKKMYENKILLIKHPKKNINKSQTGRAASFLENIKNLPRRIELADAKEIKFGKTKITFSRPLWHGVRRTNLGYVVMVRIQDGDKVFLHSSDVDGPILPETTKEIIRARPDILVLDGPPTYVLGYLHAYYNLARSIINTFKIMRKTDAELLILDHHLLRDYRYPDLYCEIYKKAKKFGLRVCTAAEFVGKEPAVLSAYKRNGPTKWKEWREFKKEDVISVIKNAVDAGLIKKLWLSEVKRI